MRVLHVRFKNLNSLVGEWAIDFTHPAYGADGIFAITGPTGAGKTTILDAICLALYGRTPRLNKVTKGVNEIMSRQTGECFAEVTFETPAGRFRCHWSQHRARKKADRELQPPRHEIADARTGVLFETKLRGVAEHIEKATGMDFERFTRSMLLAQGGFAVFLQAAADERAPILEQITGTEIYSAISMRVHEIRTDTQRTLDAMQRELSGMHLLDDHQVAELTGILAEKVAQAAGLEEQLARRRSALGWLEGMAALDKELLGLKARGEDLARRQAAFEPDRLKLVRSGQALELAGDYAALNSLRAEQQKELDAQAECFRLLPACEADVLSARTALNAAIQDMAGRKVAQLQTLQIIRAVRVLDLRIEERTAPIKAARLAAVADEKTLQSLRAQLAEESRTLDQNRIELSAVTGFLDAHCVDNGLVAHLSAIRARFAALKDITAKHRAKVTDLETAERIAQQARQAFAAHAKALEEARKIPATLEGSLHEVQRRLTQTLDGRPLAEWRQTLMALAERKTILQKIADAVRSAADEQRRLEDLRAQRQVLVAQGTSLAAAIAAQVQRQSGLERELQLLERQFKLLRQIADFSAARQQLQDGVPCPLCGAIAHPFAAGNVPVADETLAELESAREALKQTVTAVSALKIKEGRAHKELELTALAQTECSARLATANAAIMQGCDDLKLRLAGSDLPSAIALLLEETECDWHAARVTVQTAEEIGEKSDDVRAQIEKARQVLADAEREVRTADHRQETAQETLQRVGLELEALTEQRQAAQVDSERELSVYGIASLRVEELDAIAESLAERREKWLAGQARKVDLDKCVAALEAQQRHRKEQIGQLDREMRARREILAQLIREQEGFASERHDLFGAKDADTEEKRLAAALEAAHQKVDGLQHALHAAQQALGQMHHRMQTLETSLQARAMTLQAGEAAFCGRLAGCGFIDEADYRAACLNEAERQALARQAEGMATEQARLEATCHDRLERLAAERQKNLTDRPREHLELEVAEQAGALQEVQQAVGATRQKLRDNETLRDRQQARAKAVDAHKKECARWDDLHALIGAADGKKYRNFAQGLTFDMMIGHANRRLAMMTDRYLLTRDIHQPLELNVIDSYQAGEIRSTKNLSGGESFIVSLALALGLSQMAGRNVRVESLFLDEGFGTLDDEALDTALETLAGLRHDGTLIGVISHVAALQERIGTRIQVVPRTGGTSILRGPGCGSE